MHLKLEKDHKGTLRFSGEITERDMQDIKLDDFDRAVLASPTNGPADYLQNLELLFRKSERWTMSESG